MTARNTHPRRKCEMCKRTRRGRYPRCKSCSQQAATMTNTQERPA